MHTIMTLLTPCPTIRRLAALFLCGLSASSLMADTPAPAEPPTLLAPLPRLTIDGANFVNPQGDVVRFWGTNATSFYPEHSVADAYAANLAEREINLLRPHHLFRASRDWNPGLGSGSFVDYKQDSRTFDPVLLDRFDYLNAALQREGIYLAFSVHFSRRYTAGDVAIMDTDEADAAAWQMAINELNSWDWKKAIDVRKALPTIDERAARLNEEFITRLLNHRNPYTGLTYGESSQVLTLEVVNESSIEYAIICGNRFPDYWQNKLVAKWNAFAVENGVPDPGDIYKPATQDLKVLRARFLMQLDADYYKRIRKTVRDSGCDVPMMYSNLWRGESALATQDALSEVIENHAYIDPLVVRSAKDGFNDFAYRNALADKPYFIGEFNQAEGARNIEAQSPYRTMLMVAAPAYGDFQDWSGIVWFAWNHGTPQIGPDGKGDHVHRNSSLGSMVHDAMMTDHLRTAGIMFRRSLVAASKQPITLWIDEPYWGTSYNQLMNGKYRVQPGWFNQHGIRRDYGTEPPEQASAPWLKAQTGPVIVSDTGEIVKDTVRRQLTVAAPQAEAFSGFLDGQSPVGPTHLEIAGNTGFATVILVANDNKNLSESQHLIISRTALNAELAEINGPALKLANLAGSGTWQFKVTRPAASAPTTLTPDAEGKLVLPESTWHEAELALTR